jgi:tubulin polyglutamylase TTLL6/13
MLDHKLRPWMLEVNHTPSFNCETGIDFQIKERLLKDALEIVQLSCEQRKMKEFELAREKRELQN